MSRLATPCFGIIAAAGRGRRFGGLKQLIRVQGRPLLYYSVIAFERCPRVTGYVIVTVPEELSRVGRLAASWGPRRLMAVVPGGTTRADSVANGLRRLPDRGLVAVHDGVRPLLTPSLLATGFAAAARFRAVVCAAPVADTLKLGQHGRVAKTLDRSQLFAAQTPQFFDLGLLRRAYAAAGRHRREATDDSALVERLGIRPRLWLRNRPNIKVTTRADLAVCRALL